ncbi:MAG: flippase-like domain-containing protein [Phycisphaerae bacterium]|nr:flippase-like domain-containing protein [Phycisphaerae bacterium]NUQ47915.1 flippase-like domain-containing protein [Phycisphaerae bacterium]
MTPPPKRKSRLRAWLQPIGSLVLLAILFYILPREKLWPALKSVSGRVWLLALAGYMVSHLLGAAKLHLLVNAAGGGLPLTQSIRCYYAGLFGNLLLPSIIGGDAFIIALALRRARNAAGLVLGAFINRLLDLAALALLVGGSALLVPKAFEEERYRRIYLGLAAAGAAGLIVVAVAAALLLRRGRFPIKIRRKMVRVRAALRSTRRRPGLILLALGVGVLTQSGLVLSNVALAEGCNPPFSFPLRVWMFAWPLAKLAAFAPVSQGGIGLREFVLAGLMAPFGAEAAQTVAVSLLWQTVLIAGGITCGGLSLLIARAARGTEPRP